MIYFLLIFFIILLLYLLNIVLGREKESLKEVNLILENRLKFTEKEYQKNQDQLLNLKFTEWVSENEFEIRRTAILRMNSHILENISDELSIIKNNFGFNPKDIKFVGRFIDLIIFDGAANEELVNIYFIDIERQGISKQNNYKVKVASAIARIEEGSVTFKEINL